jgi:hypothetical protein
VVNVERIVAELGIIGTRGVRRREGGRRKKEGEVSSKEEVERYHGL